MFTCKSVKHHAPRFLVATARIEPLPRGPEMGIKRSALPLLPFTLS